MRRGVAVSESGAPRVMSSWSGASCWQVRGCRLVGLLAGSAADAASGAPERS